MRFELEPDYLLIRRLTICVCIISEAVDDQYRRRFTARLINRRIYEASAPWLQAVRMPARTASLRFSSALLLSGAADDSLVKTNASDWWPWWPDIFLLVIGGVLVTVIISFVW